MGHQQPNPLLCQSCGFSGTVSPRVCNEVTAPDHHKGALSGLKSSAEHLPSRQSLYYQGPTLQKIIFYFGGPLYSFFKFLRRDLPQRALEVVDGSHGAEESQEFPCHCGESQLFHTTSEAPGLFPPETRMLQKSRAQPPEESRRKPVLGKLGTLFTAGRRRSSRNGPGSPTRSSATSASPRDVSPSKLPESAKSQRQGSQPEQPDASQERPPHEQPRGPEGERSESGVHAAPLTPGCSRGSAAAGQQGPDSDSLQLEAREAGGETFPEATAAARQLHSSPGNSFRREDAETPARRPGEDAS
ncbi:uncharacterized protein LOC110596457, partial [Carlito syrichta]|uniref:Uncharacterized protein LOC110596457 n=1 Tax=Carlito syrichta TaxID=1868482 RepID=A0A3Q0EF94_CARSF